MMLQQLPIKRKIMAVIMLTSITVLVLTVVAFVTYDLTTFRDGMVQNLSTVARVVAANSTAALAFKNHEDATENLSSLRTKSEITAAALYDAEGKLFVFYTNSAPLTEIPPVAERAGYRFEGGHLVLFQPVSQGATRLGTLFVKADLRSFYHLLEVYSGLAGLIVLGSVVVALVLSNRLQKRISDPILALASAARRVSEWRDYSVRAPKSSGDELGLLTDAFNQMLTRIQEQTVALQEGEARLRLALEASQTGAWDWNLQTNRIAWDEFLHALFGVKPGEFGRTYEHVLQLVYPEDRPLVESAVRRAQDGKTDFACEFRVQWPDGSIHYLFSRGRAFYDAGGQPVRMIGVTQDVTERRQSEEATRYLAAVVGSSDDAIIGKNLDSIITSWNMGAERHFGFSAQEALGQSITITIPDDRSKEEPSILERIRRGERIEHYETVRRRKDGSLLDVALTVSPIKDAEGRIVGASTIARDITDRKRYREALEAQARTLREQAQMLDLANVMARDLDDHIILWNTGMEKMYGWLRTETLGRLSHVVLQTQFPKPIGQIREILMRDGHWEGEVVHTRKDGTPITVASQWVLHRGDHNQPTAILEVNTDITERKEAERQILRMNAELEKRVQERTRELTAANQELEAFTYSVAHDLRAPLRHIDAFSKIIADEFSDSLTPEVRHYLENIRKGSRNMSRLVDDLLNLARVGRQELKREWVPLSPLVDEVVAELRSETAHRKVEWSIAPLPAVEGDPILMKQVFANLLSNAIKYTRPRQKARIEIGQQWIDHQNVIFVRDNGVGFSMKYADKLFGVFQRLHRADEFEGTGVGLATVDRVVRKHGGRIWAEAEVDQGATFYFTLDALNRNAAQHKFNDQERNSNSAG